MMKVKIISEKDTLPAYATAGSSGLDLMASLTEPAVIEPNKIVMIKTGIRIELPVGYEAQIRARSGLAFKHGITLANSVGTIDSDYRGEIMIPLINHGSEDFIVNDGDRIAQMIICRYERIEWERVNKLDETKRDDQGFGHSGI